MLGRVLAADAAVLRLAGILSDLSVPGITLPLPVPSKDGPASERVLPCWKDEQSADMQVSSSDHCERTILSTVSIFAKGQINEECLLGNVKN